ncbi:MAG: PIN domain-containing protein [Syntrophaceae bacterium]|nr:PIN domain-containing protein [Syntrophaceae bacterium]
MKKQGRRLPDTNVIVRYLVKDDIELYKQAKTFFDKVKTGEESALILESVIAECVYILTKIYKAPKEKTAESLKNLLRYRGIVNEDRVDLIKALSTYAEQSLDIVDCILYVKAKDTDAGLFSFDEDLNKLASDGR